MRKKRLAVILGQCLCVCVLALPLNAMTVTVSAAEVSGAYEDIQEAGSEVEITIGVSGFVQLPAAVPPEEPDPEEPGPEEPGPEEPDPEEPGPEEPDPEEPGEEEPDPEEPGENSNKAVVTPVTTNRTAAPQTGDEAHTGWYILQLMLAAIAISLMIRQIKNKETRSMGGVNNAL